MGLSEKVYEDSNGVEALTDLSSEQLRGEIPGQEDIPQSRHEDLLKKGVFSWPSSLLGRVMHRPDMPCKTTSALGLAIVMLLLAHIQESSTRLNWRPCRSYDVDRMVSTHKLEG